MSNKGWFTTNFYELWHKEKYRPAMENRITLSYEGKLHAMRLRDPKQ